MASVATYPSHTAAAQTISPVSAGFPFPFPLALSLSSQAGLILIYPHVLPPLPHLTDTGAVGGHRSTTHYPLSLLPYLFTKIYYLLYIIHLLRRNCGPKILVRAAHIIKRRSADRSVLLIICVRPRLAAVGWVGL